MPDPSAGPGAEPQKSPDAVGGPGTGGVPDRTDVPETIATYLRLRGLEPSARSFRKRRRRTVDDDNIPFAPGRDPRGVGDVIADLTREAGWNGQLAREDVVRAWAEVAGEDTARHTRPVAFSEGSLTVQADSTAWAKQLQLMRAHILSEIVRRFPEAKVDSVRFIGPDVPSWKWGPRTIPGRGPRDTYG
ncbi:DUF721 domain-containing protein [Microbacterium sp. LMI12-1-1.1]|uniref:DUF721 domain-containing protein n=1 Tax=Microbacterium sp. LMI12-1-1.1 TaxID=3135225 RepID=UPI003411F836